MYISFFFFFFSFFILNSTRLDIEGYLTKRKFVYDKSVLITHDSITLDSVKYTPPILWMRLV
jgi:hypothetical protein